MPGLFTALSFLDADREFAREIRVQSFCFTDLRLGGGVHLLLPFWREEQAEVFACGPPSCSVVLSLTEVVAAR